MAAVRREKHFPEAAVAVCSSGSRRFSHGERNVFMYAEGVRAGTTAPLLSPTRVGLNLGGKVQSYLEMTLASQSYNATLGLCRRDRIWKDEQLISGASVINYNKFA